MAIFATTMQVDMTGFHNWTVGSVRYHMVSPSTFQYSNVITEIGSSIYGPSLDYNAPLDDLSGAVTQISFFLGSPGAIGTGFADFSGLSVDAGVVDPFILSQDQATSLSQLDIMLSGNDTISGSALDDVLTGGAGADTLNGGAAADIVSYMTSATGVTVSLVSGLGKGGDAEGDTLISIEGLVGSDHRDVLVGDGVSNTLSGGGGNDLLMGGGSGDLLDGGDGIDTVSYATSPAGVTVNLAAGFGRDGDAGGDTLVSIESLIGSALADDLTGSDGDNRIQGGAGNDLITGLMGDDTLLGEAGDDELFGDEGADTLNGGDGLDYLHGGTGDDRLSGGDGNDRLVGGTGRDVLTGGVGNDVFIFEDLDGNADVVRDWETGDRLRLDFLAGDIPLDQLTNGTTTRGLEGEGVFYNSANGRLYVFDSENDVLTHFATLSTKPTELTTGDFMWV